MFTSYDKNHYIQLLENTIFEHFDLFTRLGYSEDIYQDLSDMTMCERILFEKLSNISSFISSESYTPKQMIADAIFMERDRIFDWVSRRPVEFQSIADYDELVLNLCIGVNETAGRGFDQNFEEQKTNAIQVKLLRSNADVTPFGFYIKTAHPLIDQEHCVHTGKKYTKEQVILNSGKLTLFEKIRALNNELLTRPYVKTEIDTSQLTGEDFLRITYGSVPDKKYVCWIYKDYERYALCDLKGLNKSELSFSEITTACPEFQKIIMPCIISRNQLLNGIIPEKIQKKDIRRKNDDLLH